MQTPLFKEKFDNWRQLFPKNLDYGVSAQLLPSSTSKKHISSFVVCINCPCFKKERIELPKEELDVEKLITTKPKPRPENALIHAGTGVLKVLCIQTLRQLTNTYQIWKIEDFKKVEIPESQHGIFFSASCYICLYMEIKDQRRSHYIYFWQGRHSTKVTTVAVTVYFILI